MDLFDLNELEEIIEIERDDDDDDDNNDEEVDFEDEEIEDYEFVLTDSSNSNNNLITSHRSTCISRKRIFTKQIPNYYIRRRKSQFPRILKRDFRRHFPNMFTNVINSFDHMLIKQFIDHFFWEKCILRIQSQEIQQSIIKLEGHGKDYVMNNIFLAMISYPDLTFQIKEASIKRSLHSEICKVDVCFHVSGSIITSNQQIESNKHDLIYFLQSNTTINNGFNFEYQHAANSLPKLSFVFDKNLHVLEINIKLEDLNAERR